MQNKSVECDIIKAKLNSRIEDFRLAGNLENMEENTLAYLEKCLNELGEYQKVTVEPTVETRKKGIIGKIVIFFKRLCRKIVAWYLQPVCDDQTRYNHQAYLVMMSINKVLTDQVDEYKKQCMELQKEKEEFRILLDKMNYEMDLLKSDIKK